MIAFIVQLVFIVVAVSYLFFLTENEINRHRKGYIIYYASNLNVVLGGITKYLNNVKDLTFVELGAGQAPVARALAKGYPWKEVVAVEWTRSLTFLAKARAKLAGAPVTVIRGSVYEYTAPKRSIIYCYLSTEILERLYAQGSFKNCLVFSLTFVIPEVAPTEIIDINTWQSPLRVYDFR